jgi:alcohol dehydrogenase
MKAIGVHQYLPTSDPDCFVEFDQATPAPGPRDLLVRIKAVSVNPVDTKVRAGISAEPGEPRVLGWDAAGIVEQVGNEASLFKPGDAAWYAGSITRPGCNAELQCVDERIAGHKPASLGYAEAAAMPLTAITAWEALFERLGIHRLKDAGKSILIIGGAGGVGSIAIQMASEIAGLAVIATASRDETMAWCRKMGASECINHRNDMKQELERIGVAEVDYILCLNDTDYYFAIMADVIKPQGKICSIVGNSRPLDLDLLKSKSATFAWEFMFTRAMYETDDMHRQHELLEEVARLIDAGRLQTTLTCQHGTMSAETLRTAHAELESGRMIGKLVLDGMAS